MWLSDLSIKRPVFISMATLAVLLVGALLYRQMPVDLFPDVSVPVVAVRTVYPGATPSEIETLVSRPIEDAVSSLNYVETVQSSSIESLSLVIIEFQVGYSSKEAADEVRQQLATLRNDLPRDAYEPDTLRVDPAMSPILSLVVADRRGEMPLDRLRDLVDGEIVDRIQRVPGVGTVTLTGGLEREIQVELSAERLMALGLSPQQVIAAIQSESLDVPGGSVVEADRELMLRTAGQFTSLDDIGRVPLATPLGGTVYLRDIATIADGFRETRSRSRLNGHDSVAIAVQKQSGTNTVRVAEEVKTEIDRIRAERPDLEIVVVIDQSVYTRAATDDVLTSVLIGVLLACIVILLFLGDLRNTIVTIAGIPFTMLGTFAVISLAGFSINMITLLALSLSIGLMVDDAIVVRENIFRHVENGEDPPTAASRGTAEVALAVVATTLTVVAVFAPIGLTPGIAGTFLREFGLTVAITALISTVEAFTLGPMLASVFFRRIRGREQRGEALGGAYRAIEAGYRRTLDWSLRHRSVVVILGIAALVASLSLLPILGQSFVADFDQSEARVNLEMPAGTTVDEMDEVTRRVEDMLLRQPQTASVFSVVGSTAYDAGVNRSYVVVKLRERGMLDGFQRQIRQELVNLDLNGAKFDIDLMANTFTGMLTAGVGTMSLRPLEFGIYGSDLADLDVVSLQVMEMLRQIPGVVDVDRSLRPGRPEIQVEVDRVRAADLGISTAQIGMTIRALINGEVAASYEQEGGRGVDILVRLRPEDRASLASIERIPVVSPRGALVPLTSVASLSTGIGPSRIDRRNRQRQVVVGAGYLGRQLGEITADANEALAALDLPPGVSVEITGQARYMEQAFGDLTFALVLAVIFLYMVLASQFGSFVHPFTIMLALPLSLFGAFLSLLASGLPIDMMALIGIIMLMGLVTKNSILLVEFINALRGQGHSVAEAILRAGPVRLRPILMTTLAMICGMMPVALGFGAGAEVRMPMAITMVGGLTSSTLLTLIVVPVGYSLVESLQARIRHRSAEPMRVSEIGTPV